MQRCKYRHGPINAPKCSNQPGNGQWRVAKLIGHFASGSTEAHVPIKWSLIYTVFECFTNMPFALIHYGCRLFRCMMCACNLEQTEFDLSILLAFVCYITGFSTPFLLPRSMGTEWPKASQTIVQSDGQCPSVSR